MHLRSSISSICRRPPSRQCPQYPQNQLLSLRSDAPNDWHDLVKHLVGHVDRRPNKKYIRHQPRPLLAEWELPSRVLKPKEKINKIYCFSHSIELWLNWAVQRHLWGSNKFCFIASNWHRRLRELLRNWNCCCKSYFFLSLQFMFAIGVINPRPVSFFVVVLWRNKLTKK